MPSTNLIECLKPGRHIDANGTVVSFSAEDLANIAAVYDPAKHEAQFVVGHPEMDTPSYGASSAFVWDGKVLGCATKNVEPQFAELVNAGRFPKVSLALYGPNSPSNPVPGSWYPKHVGFLGAKPPAIKGLKSAQFSEGEEGVHVFMEARADFAFLSIFKNLCDWFLTSQGQEVADRVVPGWVVDGAQADLVRDQVEDQASAGPAFNTSFSEPNTQPSIEQEADVADKDLAAQLAESQAQLAALNAQAAQRQAADLAALDKTRREAAVAFAEKVTGEHKLKPKFRDVLIASHIALATPNADGAVLNFGEGDEKRDALTDLEAMFADLSEVVPKGELVTGALDKVRTAGGEGHQAPELTFAEGTNLDPARVALDKRARELMDEKGLPYFEAIRQASKG